MCLHTLSRNLVIVVGVLATTLVHAGLHARQVKSTSLFDFEGQAIPGTVKTSGAEVQVVTGQGVTSGERALLVRFPAEGENAGVRLEAEGAWDWSQKSDSGVMFDVANVGDKSVHLHVEVADAAGGQRLASASIPADGKSHTYYTMVNSDLLGIDSGMRDDPAAWSIDGEKLVSSHSGQYVNPAKIVRIKLYTTVTLEERSLVVDNVRFFSEAQRKPEFLGQVCDRFGQYAGAEYPTKVHSLEELQQKAGEELEHLATSQPMADRSQFGGWKDGPHLRATGYFRTEKIGDKWALVDPEGYLYFSTGLANARMANTATMTGIDFREPTMREFDPEDVTPEDSKGFVETDAKARESRFVASELRHDLFEWLPEYDDPLADHYTYVRSVHKGPVRHGEAFSFYQANLERRYGETSPKSYLTTWRDVTVDRMLDWGFTSMGNWTDASYFQNDKIPYFANGWIIGDFKTVNTGKEYWSPMPDPFDPEFVRRAHVTTKAIAEEVKGSPWCVGVFIDNEKSWGRVGNFESQYGIVIAALKSDAQESPTKAAFVELLRQKYETIDNLNEAWKTNVSSWDDLAAGVSVAARNRVVTKDFSDLLHAYAREYFRVVSQALNEVMPNHMYMGVRMAHWGLTPEVVAAAKEFSDVISYNYYKEGIRDDEWEFLREVDMPSIIGEFHMGALEGSGMFHPGLVAASDQADRGRMFKEYMESVIDNPYFVGAHWFQYIDSPLTGRSYDGENYNVGFVSTTDIPYPELVEAAQELNQSLYERRYGDVADSAMENAGRESTSKSR